MPKFRRYAAFPAVIIPLALALFCGKGSNNPTAVQENGMLEIRARVVNKALAKSGAAAETAANRLVVQVTAADMDTMRIELKLDPARPSVGDTLTDIPPGKNRKVAIWAVDKNGGKTHIDSLENRGAVNIEKATVTPIFATLIPAAGSIYLQFTGLDTKVETVYASFTALDGTLVAESAVKRAAKMFMSLDNIPHETDGVLRVAVIAAGGDTTLIAADTLKFNARADNSVDLQFVKNSGMSKIEVAMYAPGVTTGSYDFKNSESAAAETGELIITEIMWNVSNDNYIELYNPGDTAVFFNTLTTDVDGTTRDFDNITVAAKGYLVIGRQNLPHVDIYAPTTGGLPITTTGNWISVRRGKTGAVVDMVICAGNNSATGWPPVSGKRSIELARDKYNAIDNNYGKNWSAAEEFISDESSQYGTPGR